MTASDKQLFCDPAALREEITQALRGLWSTPDPEMPGFIYPDKMQIDAAYPALVSEKPCGIYVVSFDRTKLDEPTIDYGRTVSDSRASETAVFSVMTPIRIIHRHPEYAPCDKMAFKTALFISSVLKKMLLCAFPSLRHISVEGVAHPTIMRDGQPQAVREFYSFVDLVAAYTAAIDVYEAGLLLKRVNLNTAPVDT